MKLEEKVKCKVPFGTVSIQPEAIHLINTFLANRMVTNGKCVKAFEDAFADKFGTKFACAVSSGTDANTIALAALYDYGAERGDEVIVPALSFVATGNCVLNAGFKPVFVDVTRDTLNIDVSKLESAITPRTVAIMPVHLMGKPADMDSVMYFANKHNLHVIEDCAEAHGAEYDGKLVGTIGHMACYSLYAAHIVTSIEGGMITTNIRSMDEACRSLRNHGIVEKFKFKRAGFSSKMNELEAAIGYTNVENFEKILAKRRRNLYYMINLFKEFEEYFIYLKETPNEKIGPHAFSIIVREGCKFSKEQFVAFIEKMGIDSRNLFYSIPTQVESYSFLGHKLGDFPEAEFCSDRGLHIGCHQDLELSQLDYIAECVRVFLKGY